MSTPDDRHSRRRLATRQRISNIATALFAEKGFDAVTIDAIAEAADVGRMTVFNHFARKEDLFFDREPALRQMLRETLACHTSPHPLEALRQLAHRLIAEETPFLRFSPQTLEFVRTLAASEALKSRARAFRDEMAEDIHLGLIDALDRAPTDPAPALAASLIVAGWSTAYSEALKAFARGKNSKSAQLLFLSLVDTSTAAALYTLR